VVTYERTDYSGLINNYDVYIGNDETITNNPKCPGGPFNGPQTINCNLSGKYLSIWRNDGYYLALCEVEAYEF